MMKNLLARQYYQFKLCSKPFYKVNIMQCIIFKSRRKVDTYLYISHSLECLPCELFKALQPFEQVMQLNLHPNRKLANADAKKVLNSLLKQGFYLQMPKEQTLNILKFNEAIHVD